MLQSGAMATRRPRAFGRTSNVWQYVETVQERLTPLTKLREVTSSGDQLRRTSLDFNEDEEDEEDNEGFRDDGQSRLSSFAGGQYRRHDGDRTGDGYQELPKRKYSKALALNQGGIGGRRKQSNKIGAMKSVSSLPDLYPSFAGSGGEPGGGGGMKNNGSTSAGLSSATNRRNLYSGVGTGGPGSNLSPNGRKGNASGSNFSSTEIIKRIQALGSSASVPYMTPAASLHGGEATLGGQFPGGTVDAKSTTGGQLNPQGPLAPGSIVTPSAAIAAATTTSQPGATLSDAEKLRNDFNSQQSKLYYGCSVAFELFNGHLMMVGSPDGQVRVQSLEKLQIPQIKGCRDRAIFTLIDLTDVRSANTICYGDAVWLQLSIGTGEISWEQGGVLGAKVREAPQLKALALANDDSIRNNVQVPAVVGHPVPVKAYLPKVSEPNCYTGLLLMT